MRRTRLALAALVLATLVLGALVLGGCASRSAENGGTTPGETTTSVEPTSTPGGSGDSTSGLPPAGLVELSGGRVRVTGVLARIDLEGGFWAVVDAPAGIELSGEEPIVAVVLLPESGMHGADLNALAGTYMQFDGTLVEGASIRMAGPEVMVESFTMLERK